jgi:integrase
MICVGTESKGDSCLQRRRSRRRTRLPRAFAFEGPFGTATAGAGAPMRTLQECMGHRDIETTQRYADYAPRTRAAELDRAVGGHGQHPLRRLGARP